VVEFKSDFSPICQMYVLAIGLFKQKHIFLVALCLVSDTFKIVPYLVSCCHTTKAYIHKT
jgi:arginine exporter protein ArgO